MTAQEFEKEYIELRDLFIKLHPGEPIVLTKEFIEEFNNNNLTQKGEIKMNKEKMLERITAREALRILGEDEFRRM